MSSFKSRIRRKSQSFPKSLKKNTMSELGVEISTFVPCERRWSWYRMTHCKVKGTGRGIVWHIAMWNTLVVLPYGAFSYSTGRGTVWRLFILHWLCYRMTHCQVKGTGRGTVWHIAMWKALVMVPYDTLPGERHWPWYRKTHCQMKGTDPDSEWYIAMWNTLVVVPHYTLPGEIHLLWHSMT
jgi:hypothetical protein